MIPILKQPEFGRLIKELRHRTGLSQEGFSLKVGVSYASINRWENCRTMPVQIVVRRVEEVVKDMGDRGQDLLEQYFPERRGN
jgi:DNA-binding transcriptional regulator YiaG